MFSSTNEGVQDIAGQRGASQAETAGGIAAEAEVELEEDVTATDPRVARRPIKPTKAMIQAHELHHTDYRDWCDRVGKGLSRQQRASENANEEAKFSVDYTLMTKDGSVELEMDMSEAEKVGAAPVLVGSQLF